MRLYHPHQNGRGEPHKSESIIIIRCFCPKVNNPRPSSKCTIPASCRAKKQAATARNFELEFELETVLELEFELEILQLAATQISSRGLGKPMAFRRAPRTSFIRFRMRPPVRVKCSTQKSSFAYAARGDLVFRTDLNFRQKLP